MPTLPKAQAGEVVVVLPSSGDGVEELISWLDQLCFVVHCSADRSATDITNKSDWIAVRFVLSYEAYGVRDDLSLAERDYAHFASLRATQILVDNPGQLDPEIELALFVALKSIRSDLKE